MKEEIVIPLDRSLRGIRRWINVAGIIAFLVIFPALAIWFLVSSVATPSPGSRERFMGTAGLLAICGVIITAVAGSHTTTRITESGPTTEWTSKRPERLGAKWAIWWFGRLLSIIAGIAALFFSLH